MRDGGGGDAGARSQRSVRGRGQLDPRARRGAAAGDGGVGGHRRGGHQLQRRVNRRHLDLVPERRGSREFRGGRAVGSEARGEHHTSEGHRRGSSRRSARGHLAPPDALDAKHALAATRGDLKKRPPRAALGADDAPRGSGGVAITSGCGVHTRRGAGNRGIPSRARIRRNSERVRRVGRRGIPEPRLDDVGRQRRSSGHSDGRRHGSG
mmetsp:Transcript_32329/g.79830  ORF Transcript_32329/g.79830 Transcript_32329/m.79830 type:complete len:209 (+) Transcript_32329:490-1116(+)